MVNEEALKRIKADTPWEEVNKIADEVQKQGRVYVDNPSEAPKGTQLRRGPKGGMYYEEHGGAEKPKEERAGKSIKEYKVGQKVRDREGNVHTVLRVDERGVWTGPNTWHHPSNLSVVAQPKEEKPAAPKEEKPNMDVKERLNIIWKLPSINPMNPKDVEYVKNNIQAWKDIGSPITHSKESIEKLEDDFLKISRDKRKDLSFQLIQILAEDPMVLKIAHESIKD